MVESDKLLPRGVPATYTVHYPSGRTFSVRGVFSILGSADPELGHGPAIKTATGELAVLDPRAVISRTAGVIYTPRSNAYLARWAQAWLHEHPEWPAVVEA
jgi:hypothetical protein